MKLVLYNDHLPGVLKGESVVGIAGQVAMGRTGQETIVNIIEDWGALKPRLESFVAANEGVPLASVRLRAPVPKPGKIMCMAANFREGTDKPPLPINGDGKMETNIASSDGIPGFRVPVSAPMSVELDSDQKTAVSTTPTTGAILARLQAERLSRVEAFADWDILFG